MATGEQLESYDLKKFDDLIDDFKFLLKSIFSSDSKCTIESLLNHDFFNASNYKNEVIYELVKLNLKSRK
jgi:hypothetical protein